MKLFLHLLTLFATFGHVLSYSIPGSYERLLYYYAYLLDVGNGGTASKIATGCAKIMGTGGAPCNFNQFVEYINNDSKATNFNVVPAGTAEPDVGDTATKLQRMGLTGSINVSRVVKSVSQSDYDDLIRAVGQYLEGTIASGSDTIRAALIESSQGVARGRANASLGKIETALEAKGYTLVRVGEPLYEGAPAAYNIDNIDIGNTLANNNGLTRKELRTIIASQLDEDHKSTLNSGRYTAAVVTRACIAAES